MPITNKLIIVSAPSGAGKTTIVNHLLRTFNELSFSISATSRSIRQGETDGVNYYFISKIEFENKIKENAFVEWEEVYPGTYYGTLVSELERIWRLGKIVVFDVDVYGGLNLKQLYGEAALSIFINVPSVDELELRLRNRNTENNQAIEMRISKALQEIANKEGFDHIIMNDNLEYAKKQAEELVKNFINQ
jgi:guanylate kinase